MGSRFGTRMNDLHTVRRQALLNGGMVALGAVAVIDNVVSHWWLGLHRAVPSDAATAVEVFLVILGVALVAIGLRREVNQRRALSLE